MTIKLTESFIDDGDLWSQIIENGGTQGRPALILDRDGVVIDEVVYIHRAQDVRLVPGGAAVIRAANERGVPVVIVTNQGGIGVRYYDWRHFADVQGKMLAELSDAGAAINAVFACPHHENGRGTFRHANHPARKPNPGMLLMAAEQLGIDLSASWIVGDRATDLRAGRNAGCAGGVHVRTGHGIRQGEREDAMALAEDGFEVETLPSLAEVAGVIPFLHG